MNTGLVEGESLDPNSPGGLSSLDPVGIVQSSPLFIASLSPFQHLVIGHSCH